MFCYVEFCSLWFQIIVVCLAAYKQYFATFFFNIGLDLEWSVSGFILISWLCYSDILKFAWPITGKMFSFAFFYINHAYA